MTAALAKTLTRERGAFAPNSPRTAERARRRWRDAIRAVLAQLYPAKYADRSRFYYTAALQAAAAANDAVKRAAAAIAQPGGRWTATHSRATSSERRFRRHSIAVSPAPFQRGPGPGGAGPPMIVEEDEDEERPGALQALGFLYEDFRMRRLAFLCGSAHAPSRPARPPPPPPPPAASPAPRPFPLDDPPPRARLISAPPPTFPAPRAPLGDPAAPKTPAPPPSRPAPPPLVTPPSAR
eukprot:tig00000581_g2220.t1